MKAGDGAPPTAPVRALAAIVAGPLLFLALSLVPPPTGMSAGGWSLVALLAWMVVWWVSEALPLAATAPVLVRPCVDIACYYLAQQATMLTDELRQRYEDAVKLLRDFAEGRATLSLDTDDDGKAESGPQVISVSGPPRLFSRETMRDLG